MKPGRFRSRTKLRVMLQSEAAECGLACIAMIAGFHGKQIDLTSLRRRYAVSLRGSTFESLRDVGQQMEFSTKAIRLESDQLLLLQLPAILHWNQNHFVVLDHIDGKAAFVRDPAIGRRKLSMEALSEQFTGMALELTPTSRFMPKDERERLSLGQFLKSIAGLVGLRKYLIQLVVLSIGVQILALLSPLYIQQVVDKAVIRHDEGLLRLLALGFFAVLGLQAALTWLRASIVLYLGNLLALQLQRGLLTHLLMLPLSFFAKRHVGDIVSRFGSTGALQNLLTTVLVAIVIDGLIVCFTFIALLMYQPHLCFWVTGLLGVYTIVRVLRFAVLRDQFAENLMIVSENNSQFMETIRKMATVKILGLESERLSLWESRYIGVTNSNVRIGRMNLSFNTITRIMLGGGHIFIIYLGANLIFDGSLTVGMLMAFLAYQMQFLAAGTDLVDQCNQYQMLGLHLERIADIALTHPEDKIATPSALLDRSDSQLLIEHIKFRYAASDPYLLNDISLSVQPGECIAITGPSGAGKSTLMRIMLGLEEPLEGSVKFADLDIKQIGLSNYRKIVAAVTQEDRLFSGSIADNISRFSSQHDIDWMTECAKRCCIHDTIMALPMTYHTLIGEMADSLSAGERQRIMLARALYGRPKIIFLDEFTSNLDHDLDVRINAALSELNIARVIIAHRRISLRYADRVYRLCNGSFELTAVSSDQQMLLGRQPADRHQPEHPEVGAMSLQMPR